MAKEVFGGSPLAVTIGILGNFISVLVYLAPVTTFYRICKKKSTESFSSLPYLVALFSSMLWLYYALLRGDFLLITINSFGCVVETIYIALYLIYAPKQKRKTTLIIIVIMNLGMFCLIFLTVHHLSKGLHRANILGWLCMTFSICVFAAPFTIVAKVVRTKSVEFMPFTLSLFLTISAVMWFTYGLFLKDMCIALPNVVGFFLGLIQMILYAVYRNANKVVIDEKKKTIQELDNVVVVSETRPVQTPPQKREDDELVVIPLETNMKPM
ncbi:hypothetical protein ACFE04_023287 [Oxalis oulophora]